MCMLSMVIDQTPNQYPPINTWPIQQIVDMTEVIRLLTEIDKKLGAKDCYDVKKEEFVKKLETCLEILKQENS